SSLDFLVKHALLSRRKGRAAMLKSVAEDVWVLQSEVHVPAGRMPVQMTVVRGEGGALLLHSPVTLDDAAAAELRDLGEVEAIVAPSCFHYLFLCAVSAR